MTDTDDLARAREVLGSATPGPWGYPTWDASTARVSISLTDFSYDCWHSPGGSAFRDRDMKNGEAIVFAVNFARFAFSEEGVEAMARETERALGVGRRQWSLLVVRAILARLAAGLSTGEGE